MAEQDAIKQTYFVRPHQAGFWEIVSDCPGCPVRVHPSQNEALNKARRLARLNLPSRIVVFDLSGNVRAEYAYRADPLDRPGTGRA